MKIWSYIRKGVVALLVVALLCILYEWQHLYNDPDFRPDLGQIDRLQESFGAGLLYGIWGGFATIGRVFSGGGVVPDKVLP